MTDLPLEQMIKDAEHCSRYGPIAADVSIHVKALVAEVERLKSSYHRGFIDALVCFAYWKDGVQYVGNCGQTLKGVIETLDRNPFYTPEGEA